MKNVKGITLIALVITIVVLIILASVGIYLSLGENGIFNKAKYATQEYANEQAKEEAEIGKISNEIESHVGSSRTTDDSVTDVINNKLGKTLLLEETVIQDGQEYELNESITNYERIKIFLAVVTQKDYSDVVWVSNEIYTEDIVLYTEENILRTIFPVSAVASTTAYRIPHFLFTENNKIKVSATNSSGWSNSPSDGMRIKVYGYNY